MLLLFALLSAIASSTPLVVRPQARQNFQLGACRIVIDDLCPDPEVTFYLYTLKHADQPEIIRVGADPRVSNLSSSSYDPTKPVKIIIHGYNSDSRLNALVEVRRQYLLYNECNVFMVDWGPLAAGPCYPAAVWNIRHVGKCAAQLVQRIRETGNQQIHIVGFSLGAQVTNFIAANLAPYKVPRITGLDPAGPGFITASSANKLDKSDALFVDVIHTNAFIQGVFEETGHVDFFLNGGVIQPGCWAESRFFACNHHRAPLYFAESIGTAVGFYGWPCPSYGDYFLGRCPPKEPQIIMGEHVKKGAVGGVHLVITDSVAPFAVGKFTGPAIEILRKSEAQRVTLLLRYRQEIMGMMDEGDLMESLNRVNGTFGGDYFAVEPSVDLIF